MRGVLRRHSASSRGAAGCESPARKCRDNGCGTNRVRFSGRHNSLTERQGCDTRGPKETCAPLPRRAKLQFKRSYRSFCATGFLMIYIPLTNKLLSDCARATSKI